ncbi:MAG: glycosyltransferase [Calditrichaeota bacterium]|nr:MAG: glycosyltransferase [Calditrichota bacterium]
MEWVFKMTIPKQILFVSKPLTPPWNDSNKNLAYQIAENNPEFIFKLMTKTGMKFSSKHLRDIQIYKDSGKLSPPLLQNLRVLIYLLGIGKSIELKHYFFTPNKLTSSVGKLVTKLQKKKTVQTLTSFPNETANIKDLLFADKVVALSKDSAQKLKSLGVEGVEVIYPGIETPVEVNTLKVNMLKKQYKSNDEKLILYCGDYHYSNCENILTSFIGEIKNLNFECNFVSACRIKTHLDFKVESNLKSVVDKLGLSKRVHFLNEIDYIRELLAAADLVIFPVNSLFAKMDIPLVLLEALYLETPILISDFAPLNEILIEKCGLKFAPNDFNDFISKFKLFFSDSNLQKNIISKTRLNVINNFSSKVMAENYRKIYKELLI